MSVVSTIGNIKNARDLQAKRSEFFKTLKLRADLNKKYEDSMIQRAQIERMGVQPIQQTPRSMEEERRDELGQQQIALRHLESIMSPSQAMKAMKELPMEQIYQLNTFWGRFRDTIRGIRVGDADYFRRLFLTFLQTAKESEDFIRPIPLRESTMAKMSGDLQDAWNGWARQEIDPLTGKVIDLGRLVQKTAEELRRSVEDVKQEIRGEQQATKKIKETGVPEEGVLPGLFARAQRPRLERREPIPRGKGKGEVINELAKEAGITTDKKVVETTFTRENAVELATLVRDEEKMDNLTLQQIRAILAPFGEKASSRTVGIEKLNRVVLGSAGEEAEEAEEEGRGLYASRERGLGLYASRERGLGLFGSGRGLYGTTRVQPTPSMQTPHLVYRGDGKLRMGVAKPVHLFGRGIAPEAPPIKRENNYRQFGKYLVNMKYLHEGILNLYHETMKRVKAIPPRLISKDFQSIIYRILEKGELPRSLFYKLSDAEQTFLREVLKRAWLAEKLGMGDQGRKKGMFEDETDEDMRRFNLLKGIVIAGNNDKKVVNELMSYLHKFVEERRIEPKMGNDILRNLAIAV